MEINYEGFVGIFDNYFGKEYCNDLITHFEKCHEMNMTNHTTENIVKSPKSINDMDELYLLDLNNSQHLDPYFHKHFYDVLWFAYKEYIKNFSMIDNLHVTARNIKMKRIKPGQGFHGWHYENIREGCEFRLLVAQVYLNDIDDAGETEFLYQNKRFKPKQDRLLFFPTDWTHSHRGNPPIGETTKYILTTWLEVTPN